jgi:hypothetical protein
MPQAAARVLMFLCVAQFGFWYAPHLLEGSGFPLDVLRFDVWNSVNHGNPERRIQVNRALAATPGKLVVIVRYWPRHAFQDEWVYNEAEIDGARVIWARDLGDAANSRLLQRYAGRKFLLLEPDARPPVISDYVVVPEVVPEEKKVEDKKEPAGKKPLLQFEDIR